MKSIGKILLFLVFVFITHVSYGQERANNSLESYIFKVWGDGNERALLRWNSSITILESRDPFRISFYDQSWNQNPSEYFLFAKDYSFNIRKSLSGGYGQFNIRAGASNDRFWLGSQSNHLLTIGVNGRGLVNFLPDRCTVFYKDGNDSGTINISAANRARYALFVEGGILSEDFAIGPKSSWADFVFEKDYQLTPLSEIETYISENKRLPEMPSAGEVQQDGYCLHEMNVKLLQKVEELTLYVIEQNKRIEELEKYVDDNSAIGK